MKKVILFLLIVIMTSCSTSHYFVSAVCTERKVVMDKKGGTNYITTFKTESGAIIKREQLDVYNKSVVGKKSYLEVKKNKFDHINKNY